MIQHYEQVSKNVCQTCRFFGISRSQFYMWLRRYREAGIEGLRDRLRGPRISPYRIPAEIEALILHLRKQRQYGAVRLSYFLKRYHQVFVSAPTILRIFRENRVPRVFLKRYRPRPRLRREILVPGQSVQVDVKFLKERSGRFYQFTAIDEATRYRILKLYDHNTIKSAVDFVEELQAKLQAWEHEYNYLRPHLALRGKTPAERLCELRISVPQPVRRSA